MTESSTERAAGRPIAFGDVRVGDTIERRLTRRGITYSERGTVAKIDGAYLHAAEGGVVASHYGGKSLFLIDRPKPQLPTGAGSFIEATINGEAGHVLTRPEGVGWFDLTAWRWIDSGTVSDWTLAKVVPA